MLFTLISHPVLNSFSIRFRDHAEKHSVSVDESLAASNYVGWGNAVLIGRSVGGMWGPLGRVLCRLVCGLCGMYKSPWWGAHGSTGIRCGGIVRDLLNVTYRAR